ncbi:MAG: hypothetical protein JSU97_04305 [Dehalococcoidia bacterium]|nr:MAG: hypothetical protein JSU97_04305 [Dehalococcoidia bacterium]
MAGKRIIVFSLLALAAITLGLFAASGTEAQSYKPSLGYTLDDTSGGANSTSHNIIQINAPDYNYEDSSMFSFTPLGIKTAGGIPVGAGVGDLSSSATVGLVGGPCNTALPPIFPLYMATTDTSDVLDAAAMYWLLKDKDAFPIPTAADDPELEDYLEAYPFYLNDMLDPDGAGPLPALQPIARYAGHDFVASMNVLIQLVVFSPGQLSQLPGVYAQMDSSVGNPSLVVLNNPVSADEAPGAISDFCTPLWTSTNLYDITVDNPNTTGVDESGTTFQQNPPAGTGVLASGTHIARNYSRSERDADADGVENDLDPCHFSPDPTWDVRTNCTGPPLTKPGDIDCDGLPDSCDPSGGAPGTGNSDEDLDAYTNAQDICPLVADGCKNSTCHPTIYNPAWDNQADDDAQLANPDLGPGPDSIGNNCDDSDGDGSEDGAGAGTCTDGIDNTGDTVMDELDPDCTAAFDANDGDPWGSNPGTGQFYHAMPAAAVCVGAADADTDGYCDGLETTLGGATTGTPESLVIDVTINATGALPSANVPQSCSDGLDNDLDSLTDAADPGCQAGSYAGDADFDGVADGSDNCPANYNPEQDNTDVVLAGAGASNAGVPIVGDSDGDVCDTDDDNDGRTDVQEWYQGTDPLDNCRDVAGHQAWALDNNADGSVTVVGDVLPYSGNIGASVSASPPTSWSLRRLDYDANYSITVVGDVLPFSGKIGAGCT